MDRLERVSDKTAYLVAAIGLGVSLVAAFLVPPAKGLEEWVKLVIWHGMLKWACIIVVFGIAALAVAFLAKRRERVYEWARALQLVLLPMWVFAVVVGAVAARLIWNSWELSEPRMIMSVGFTLVAAAALMAALIHGHHVVGAIGQLVTAAAMGVGLWWIGSIPAADNVHPQSAVASSTNPAFQIAALVMAGGCLVMLIALAVPVRRWLARSEAADR